MTCEEFARMMDNYDSLTDEEIMRMDIHADTCAHCKSELNFMRSIIDAAKTLPEIPVPDDFIDKLNERIDAEERKRTGFIRHIRCNWQKYSAVAACMLLAAVIGSNYGLLTDSLDNNSTPNTVNNTTASTAAPVKDSVTDSAITAADGAVSDTRAENETSVHNAARAEQGKATTSPAVRQRNSVTPVPKSGNAASADNKAENNSNDISDIPQTYDDNDPYALDKGAEPEIFAMRNIPVQGRDISASPQITDEPENSYDIMQMSEDNIAGNKSRMRQAEDEAGEENDNGYELDNKIIISREDYNDAVDIIDRYLMGKGDDEHYVISSDDVDNMLKRLRAEGIGVDDYISKDTEDIEFRIVTE